MPHPVYKRVVTKRKKFYAHDEKGEAKSGDVVRIIECRPMSKLKRWQLGEVIRKAVQVTTDLSSIGIQTGPEKRAAKKERQVARSRLRSQETRIMIGMRTILEVADNSGARRLQCILPRGGDLGLRAGLG